MNKIRFSLRVLLAALLAVTSFAAAHAQDTTSEIRIEARTPEGDAVGGVPVAVTHIPTGRTLVLTTNAQGVVTAVGLAVGGPYTVSVPEGGAFAARPVENVQLALEETELVELTVLPVASEEVTVREELIGDELAISVGHDFGLETIESVPSIARDFVSTIATEPSIVVDNSVDRGPAVSMAGGNYRYNSVTIDGVAQNDNFGLSKNASATQRTPISIDAIEAINANIAPYDVTYGNFLGGNINIVTKSGTNQFHGGVFGVTTDDGFTGNTSDGADLGIRDFSEDTYGFTVGGPIVEDRLFFFANYEKFDTTRPSNSQTLDNIAGVTQADVDRVRSVLQDEYGFDPGPFDATDKDEDEKILAKLTWNAGASHRAVASYQVADGDVLFDDFPEVAVLQSNRYNINEKLTAYSGSLFSSWSSRLATELRLGFKEVENRQISVDTTTPDFAVTASGGGLIAAGGDRFRHKNELDNESRQARIRADYQVGQHFVTAGFEEERYTVRNAFLPFSNGQYVFASIDDLRDRRVDYVLYGNSNTGVADDAETNFDLAVDALYLQDEWTLSDNFTLKLGLRYDRYDNSDTITPNPNFLAREGFSNQENLDGKDLLLPRLGFQWVPADWVTVRGGAGIYGGGTPLIMLSNAYAGDGIRRTFAQFLAPFFGPPVSDAIANALAELPDPTAAFRYLQPFIGVSAGTATDAIDPGFDILNSWKYSIGADFDLGDRWLLSADVLFTDVNDAYDIYEGRRRLADSAPDGRPIYDQPEAGDYIVTNSDRGSGTVISLLLDKSFPSTRTGGWDLTLGYTLQDVDEVRSYDRFVGYETYTFDPQTDLNNPRLDASRYEIEDRFIATVRWQKQLLGDATTSVGLVYQGRSGIHYSYVFGSNNGPTFGGSFLADYGSEGDNPGPQLFYVPTGVSDPIVTGDPGFLADLDEFISNDNCLSGLRGSIVPRNNCQTGWIHIFNVRLQQEIRAWKETSFDIFIDIENLGNLINSDWGRVESYPEPSNVAPAIVGLTANGSQYVLTPNASYQGTPETVVPRPTIARLPSVYRTQLGLRFRF